MVEGGHSLAASMGDQSRYRNKTYLFDPIARPDHMVLKPFTVVAVRVWARAVVYEPIFQNTAIKEKLQTTWSDKKN